MISINQVNQKDTDSLLSEIYSKQYMTLSYIIIYDTWDEINQVQSH